MKVEPTIGQNLVSRQKKNEGVDWFTGNTCLFVTSKCDSVNKYDLFGICEIIDWLELGNMHLLKHLYLAFMSQNWVK